MQLRLIHIISTLVVASLVMSCTPKPASPLSNIERLKKEYEIDPTADRAGLLLDSLDAYVRRNIQNKEVLQPQLREGIDVAIAQGLLSRAPSYLLPMLRLYPDDDNRKADLLSLGKIMQTLKKPHAAEVIYTEMAKLYPGDNEISQAVASVATAAAEGDLLDNLFSTILIDPDEYGVNKVAAMKYVDGVEAMALANPKYPRMSTQLYKAAEVARSMRTFPKALSLYDWVIDGYPNSQEAPNSIFIKGFILEQDYNRDVEAKALYDEFLSKYPNHEMAESVRFLVQNMGKSDQEILQQIEQNKKK